MEIIFYSSENLEEQRLDPFVTEPSFMFVIVHMLWNIILSESLQ